MKYILRASIKVLVLNDISVLLNVLVGQTLMMTLIPQQENLRLIFTLSDYVGKPPIRLII